MSDYIEKAYSVEKDIVGMEPYEQLKFVSKLYNEMAQIPPAEMGNINEFCNAHTHVESIWNYLLDDYKKNLISELEQKISNLPYCSSCSTNNKDKNIIINVEISELFFAEICYKWGSLTLNISFSQRIKDRYDNISFFNVVVRWKIIPDWLKNETKYYHGHFEKDVSLNNLIDTVLDTAKELHDKKVDIISFCRASSNIDDKGNLIVRHKNWKTKGKLESITKETPLLHVYHAKKTEQDKWDSSPYFHGSNGTYVENAIMYWCLNLKIKRPSYEVPHPIPYSVEIHNYITQTLMPKLGWERITQDRLKKLNNIIEGKTLELETTDTDQAALNREFKPVGFKDWNDYLDSIIHL